MNSSAQQRRAERLLALHHAPELLVLPNIWNPLGARMLQSLGFPAVATASAAVAFSLGYDDGESIDFETMLDMTRRIAASVDLPLSADIERGYAEAPDALADNIRCVIRAGVVGINIEDSQSEGDELVPVDQQQVRLRAVREAADGAGVHLVINARTDVFLRSGPASAAERVDEAIVRAQAYVAAGADCIYPIGAAELSTLLAIRSAAAVPINVFASAQTPPMRELQQAGIERLSIGPGLIRAAATTIKDVALELKQHGTYDRFTKDAISSDEIREYLGPGQSREGSR